MNKTKEIEDFPSGNIHHGRNIRRFRQIRGYSQDTFAKKLNITPSALCRYEQKENIDDEVLEKIAKELNFPLEALKDLSEDTAMNFISNTFENMSLGALGGNNFNCTINSIDKIVELFAGKEQLHTENEKLLQDKIDLYERLLKAEGKEIPVKKQ